MRKLIATALVALGAHAAPAAAAPLRIDEPVPGRAVLVHPHVDDVAAELELKGRARPGALVQVQARCVLGPCTTQVVAGRRGRWKTTLTIVRDAWRRKVTLRATYPADPSQEVQADYPVRLPPWASLEPYSSTAPAPRLAVIGDSLAVGTAALLRTDLPTWRVTTDGRIGRPISEGMALLAQTPLPAHEPLAFAFSLFTNDSPWNVDLLEASVRASVARLGPKSCAIWATIVRPRFAGRTYRVANRRLLALRKDPVLRERLLVVDWARVIRNHPEWLSEDGIHPTYAGYVRRAQLLAYAAEACRTGMRW